MISLATIAVLAQIQIPAPVGYVNDFAGVIDAGSSQQMLRLIDEVRAKSGGEIVVVTLADLRGQASIDVARDIGRQWRVGARGDAGDRARNAGVILLLKPGRRPGDGQAEIAIATGSGAEGFVTDALAGRIRDQIGRAFVESGSYAGGLVAGVAMLAEAYAREFGFSLEGGSVVQPRPTPTSRRTAPSGSLLGVLIPLIIIIFIVIASSRSRRGRRGGYRRYGHRWGHQPSDILTGMILGQILGGIGRHRGGGWGGGGFGGGGSGGFGGFGGGGGFSGGGASGRF